MRMIRYPFPTFPRGWFAVALGDELAEGEVLTRKAFGEEVVLYRDGEGTAHVVEPYCPHVGAHLGHGGTVVEGQIRCPFHGYRFDSSGQCAHIPGDADNPSPKIPKGLKLGKWPAREVDGAIFIWHDPAGQEPSFDIPSYFELRGADGWSDMQWKTWEGLHAHPQETSENSVDLAHFATVHGYEDMAIVEPLKVDGALLTISYKMKRDLASVGMPGQKVESIFRVRVHGLGYSVVEVSTPTFGTDFRTYVLCTPVDEETVILRGGGTMQLLPDENMNKMVEPMFFQGFCHDVEQDFDIWQNKKYLERPVLAATDGPIGPYRKYCRQFYDWPKAEAAE